MPAPAGSTAEPVWVWQSAANWRACWVARFNCAVHPGKGSTFTLYLPQTYVGTVIRRRQPERKPSIRLLRCSCPRQCDGATSESSASDDRDNLQPDDPVLLIVEDDPHYARVLCDLAHDKGFKVLVAMHGAEALALAREYHPTAISLDVFLPDMLGWTVLNHLKQDPTTRHIPVQMLTLDEDRQQGLARGAFLSLPNPPRAEGLTSALSTIKEYRSPRRKRLAGRRRQSGRTTQHSGDCWATMISISRSRQPVADALGGAESRDIRLYGSGSAFARHVGL